MLDLRLGISSLLLAFPVAAVGHAVQDGTYSLEMRGVKTAHVSGRATAQPSAMFSDAGPSYAIVLHLPKGTAPGDPSGEEFLVFSSRQRPSAAHYRAVDPGDDNAKGGLATLLSSDERTPWSTAGGQVDISASKAGGNGRTGTFAIKFIKLDGMQRPAGPTDTLFVTGKFEIP